MSRKVSLLIALSLIMFALTLLSPNLVPISNAAPAAPDAVAGEDDRESSTPTGWYWYYGQTATEIANLVSTLNLRIVDLNVETTTVPHTFAAAFVANTGVYAKTWDWAYDLNDSDIASLIAGATIRFISFKAYEISPGNVRYAAVWIDNTGADVKNWHVFVGQSQAGVGTQLAAFNSRPVQLTAYLESGVRKYAVVMIANTGADFRQTWYYFDKTPAEISTLVTSNSARVTDLDRDPTTGKYSVIMESWPTQPPNWWHLYGVSASQLGNYINQFAGRIIDINECGADCFTVAMLDNADPITARVGHMLRVGIGGQADGNTVAVGLYLKEVGGPTLAALEKNFAYQPASSIKVVEHLYAMRRVKAGTSNLTDPIVHYTNGAGSCPNPPTISGTEPLTTALKAMMRVSDNARTREISDTFGVLNFNNLMQSIGMANSQMGEIIGCGGNNMLTLADAGKLYEGVANGSLLSGQTREDFYYLMAGKEQALETGGDFTGIWKPAIDQIISQEHPLGMTTIMTQTYKSKMRLNYKAGGYTFCQGTCTDVREYISVTGLVQIPFCSGATMTLRQFAFGTFLHGVEDMSWFSGKNTLADQTFNATKAEVMREQIRAGLASCFFQTLLPLVMR